MQINIQGLTARLFTDRQDFPGIAALMQAIARYDQSVGWVSAEQLESDYQHLENSDPATDVLILQDDSGASIAYTRVGWVINDDGSQVFKFAPTVHPDWRRLDIYRAMLQWVEARIARIAKATSHPGRRVLMPIVRNALNETAISAVFEENGYKAIRYTNQMARDLAEPINLLPLPAGLEVKPVPPEQYRALTLAADEAFRDHWGHAPFSDESFAQWVSGPEFKPELWQVAWDGDQIAGGILNFFDESANQQLNTLRGWTDPIFTRRPWRKRGLARALIMLSLQMFKEMGFREAMLFVDTQNPNGALGLYESCGYKTLMRSVVYEKELA